MAIIDDVKSIISKSLKIPAERLTADARLDELGAESLDVIEIIFALEEKFNISIPFKADESPQRSLAGKNGGDEIQISTVGALVDVVNKLVEAKVPR